MKNIKYVIVPLLVAILSGCMASRQKELLGNRDFEFDHYNKAISRYSEAVSIDPENKNALLMLGWSHFKKKEFKEALDTFIQLREIAPDSRDALEGVGWSAFKLGMYKKSMQAFLAYREQDELYPGAIEGVAYNDYKLGRYTKAKGLLDIAIIEDPDSSDNYLIRGLVADVSSDWKGATKYFQRALNLSGKDDLFIKSKLAKALLNYEEYNEADRMYNSILASDPKNVAAIAGKRKLSVIKKAILEVADKLYVAGQFNESLEELSALETIYPDWPEVYARKGRIEYKKGDYSASCAEFEKGNRLYALSYHIHDGLGWCLVKLGKKEQAEQSFHKALKIYPGYPSSLAGLKEARK